MKNKNYNYEPIGIRIRRRREQLHISQEELARRTGYGGRTAISKIEKNVNGIPQDKVTLFANALQTTELYLIGTVDDPDISTEEIINTDTSYQFSKEDRILIERFHNSEPEKKHLIAYLLGIEEIKNA